MNRRRFLTVTAAALCAGRPAGAATVTEWHGTGLGASLFLRLVGDDRHRARQTFAKVEAEIDRIETTASLHRDSALTRLNRDGRLAYPSDGLFDLLVLAGQVHAATGGAFDPTVQPLWQAIANERDQQDARALIGWHRVALSRQEIRLEPGQKLTLNGIAQGWAADRIATLVGAEGYTNALIDMGEISAQGQGVDGANWTVGIAGQDGALLATTQLRNRALATSSPRGTLIGTDQPHIVGPQGQNPRWSTVAVSSPSAALADALSTAFCLMDGRAIEHTLKAFPAARLEKRI